MGFVIVGFRFSRSKSTAKSSTFWCQHAGALKGEWKLSVCDRGFPHRWEQVIETGNRLAIVLKCSAVDLDLLKTKSHYNETPTLNLKFIDYNVAMTFILIIIIIIINPDPSHWIEICFRSSGMSF